MADEHERIYKQNDDQYAKIYENSRRISNLEKEVGAIKSDLIGVTGRNGLRGEFREYKTHSDAQMKEVMRSLAEVQSRLSAWLKWTVATVIAAAGMIMTAIRVFGG